VPVIQSVSRDTAQKPNHQLTLDDTLSSQQHHHRQSAREDQILSRIQSSKGSGDLDGSLFIIPEGIVVLSYFEFLVIEVLAGPQSVSVSANTQMTDDSLSQPRN
jgi:hypothetical protein